MRDMLLGERGVDVSESPFSGEEMLQSLGWVAHLNAMVAGGQFLRCKRTLTAFASQKDAQPPGGEPGSSQHVSLGATAERSTARGLSESLSLEPPRRV